MITDFYDFLFTKRQEFIDRTGVKPKVLYVGNEIFMDAMDSKYSEFNIDTMENKVCGMVCYQVDDPYHFAFGIEKPEDLTKRQNVLSIVRK